MSPDLPADAVAMQAQVGFEVEGVPPSPAQEATLAEQHLKDQSFTSGSPTPVTIPPTFQVCYRFAASSGTHVERRRPSRAFPPTCDLRATCATSCSSESSAIDL